MNRHPNQKLTGDNNFWQGRAKSIEHQIKTLANTMPIKNRFYEIKLFQLAEELSMISKAVSVDVKEQVKFNKFLDLD